MGIGILFIVLALILFWLFFIFKDNAKKERTPWIKTDAQIFARDVEPNSVRYYATCNIDGNVCEGCSVAYTYSTTDEIYPQGTVVDIEYHVLKSGNVIFRIINCRNDELAASVKWLSNIFLVAAILLIAIACCIFILK